MRHCRNARLNIGITLVGIKNVKVLWNSSDDVDALSGASVKIRPAQRNRVMEAFDIN
jgi:hypothetical protein